MYHMSTTLQKAGIFHHFNQNSIMRESLSSSYRYRQFLKVQLANPGSHTALDKKDSTVLAAILWSNI